MTPEELEKGYGAQLENCDMSNRTGATMATIGDQEKELFAEWRNEARERGFICDGVVDEATFLDQPCHFVFVLKETNQFGNACDASLAKFLKDGAPKNGGHTWNPVCKWLTGTHRIFTQTERKNILKSIAVINLKKEDGGTTTNMNALGKRVERDKEFLKRQLGIYIMHDPVVFICCGPWLLSMLKNNVMPLLSDHDSLDLHTNGSIRYIKPYSNRKVYFVAFNHPNCRKSSSTLIDEFKKIKALCNCCY